MSIDVHVQLVPSLHENERPPFIFPAYEKTFKPGDLLRLGRKQDKKDGDFLALRSKVISRSHGELWVNRDGQVFFKDVGSSSGSFVNRLRLSPSGKESSPHVLRSGDIIQLGVDYQGRTEEIYRCVVMKVFITVTGLPIRKKPLK
jgi:pSer/pThr/pTyr-binding forkhead associated (FHA) protein